MDIHSSMIITGLELDVYIGSSLIDMYAKCGYLEDAQSTFHGLSNQNVVTWSAMISGFCQHGQGKEAFQFYKQMKQEGVKPNAYTIASLLSSCSNLLVVEEGVQMHMNCIEFGFHLDTYVGNALIDMYAKCGNLQNAYRIFNQLPNRDVVTWSSLIAGCAQNQEGQEAIQLYEAMQNDGMEPNIVTFITVLKAC
jgi:pentatricopeptide repeat protein